MLATLVKGDSKDPFSIAITPRCIGGCYSIPWIAPLYPYNAEYWARWHQVSFFESLVWPDLGLKPSFTDHWQTLYTFGQWPGKMDHALLMFQRKAHGWYLLNHLFHYILLFIKLTSQSVELCSIQKLKNP